MVFRFGKAERLGGREFKDEIVDRRLLIGAWAIVAGAVLLSWQGGPAGLGRRALAIAGGCLAWGVDNNPTRILSSADPASADRVRIAARTGLVIGAACVGFFG